MFALPIIINWWHFSQAEYALFYSLLFFPVLKWGHFICLFEAPYEVAHILVAALHCDFCYGKSCLLQQLSGVFQTQVIYVL